MAKHHTITAAMIVGGLLLAAPAAHAQTSFTQGYSDGYYDRTPLSGPPGFSTEYGRGWNAGQFDADEEFNRTMRRIDKPTAPTADPFSSTQNEQELSVLREQLEDQRMAAMSLETELEIQRIHQEADAKRKSLVDEVEQIRSDSLQSPLFTTKQLLQMTTEQALQGLNH